MAAMKILILFAVLGFLVVDGEVFQQKLIRVESRKTKMIKEGTWDEYYKNKQLVQQSFDASQNMDDFDELEYVANISIGTPPQNFSMHYSITTYSYWITDISCGNISSVYSRCPSLCYKPGGSSFCFPGCKQNDTGAATITRQQICDQKSKFNASKSHSLYLPRDPQNDFKDYEFGSVSTIYGGQDRMLLHTETAQYHNYLEVPLPRISQAQEMSPVFANTPFDGILGIRSLLNDLPNRKLTKELYSIYLQDTGNEYDVTGGYITFGGIDEKHCSPEVAYYPGQTSSDNIFDFRNITYGSSVYQDYAQVSLDTSRTSIYGPVDKIQKIKAAAGVTDDGKIDCDAKIEDFNFNIGYGDNATTLTIPAKNLLIKNSDGTCNLAFESMPPSKIVSNRWIFGTPWFRTYCTIFPFSPQEKLGFAKIIA